MGSWGVSGKASEKEKVKSEFADFLNGLNSVGDIDYSTYDKLFDLSMELFDEIYQLGLKDGVMWRK